jgi:hypothetical protein
MPAPASITFEAKVGGATAGMEQMADLVRRGAGDMERSLVSAKNAFGGLEEAAKHYKREQVQEGRLLGFYAKEIQEFIPMSAQATTAMSGIAQAGMALASGSFIGAAFEAAKVVVGYVRDAGKETLTIFQSIDAQFKVLGDHARQARLSAAEQKFEAALSAGTQSGDEYQRLRAAATKSAEAANALRKTLESDKTKEGGDEAFIANLKDAIELKEGEAEEYRRQRDAIMAHAQSELDFARGIKKGQGVGFGQTWGVQTGDDAALAGRTTGTTGSLDSVNALKKAHELAYEQMKLDLANYDKQVKASNDLVMTFAKSEGDAEAERRDKQKLAEKEAFEGRVVRARKELAEQKTVYESIGKTISSSIGGAFRSVLDGSKSASQAVGDMFKSMALGVVDVFIQMGEQWLATTIVNALLQRTTTVATNTGTIMSDAAVASAAAYASAAAIPVVGWAMAPGVAAQAYTTVAAMAPLAAIGAAENGAYLGSFSGGKLGVLHQDEMVSTAGDTKTWKSIKRIVGGGGGAQRGPTIIRLEVPVDADPEAFTKNIRRNQPQFERMLDAAIEGSMKRRGLR